MLQFVRIIVYEFYQTQIERLEQARDNGEAIDSDQVCCVIDSIYYVPGIGNRDYFTRYAGPAYYGNSILNSVD